MSMTMVGYGNLVRDPELKQVGDTNVCRFSLAITEFRKNKAGERVENTNFLDFEVWDTAAINLAKYGKKGRKIHVVAKPRQDKWEDKDGNKRSAIVFRVTDFNFLDHVKDDSQTQPTSETREEAVVTVDNEKEVPF